MMQAGKAHDRYSAWPAVSASCTTPPNAMQPSECSGSWLHFWTRRAGRRGPLLAALEVLSEEGPKPTPLTIPSASLFFYSWLQHIIHFEAQ